MVSRRVVLGAGMGGLALVGAGGVWRVTRSPQSAYGPWNLAPEPLADVRLDAFRHAILAPNPHNRQPWLIRLVDGDAADISCDLEKRLPVTDPFDRQITIGFGTFLEMARIAAAMRGYRMEIEPFPNGEAQPRLDSGPVASVRFIADPTAPVDALFDVITQRRSNKEEYDLSRPVAEERLKEVTRDGGDFIIDAQQVEQMRAQIQEAIMAEMHNHDAHMESVRLMRIGHAEVDASPDGIDLSGPMIEAGNAIGMVSRDEIADMSSSAYQTGVDQMQSTYGSIPALFWITTEDNSRASQLEAGRQYVRANLRATALGLAVHPMSQSLQEYDDVAPMYDEVHRLLGASGDQRVQMLARIGYGPKIGPSPRWPLETHLA